MIAVLKMKIYLEEYNPYWKTLFDTEKQLLISTLIDLNIVVEHIGSTSVKGLRAKPVIDIMIGLEDFNLADKQIEKIEKLGYKYISIYEDTMPFRRFFTKSENGIRTHHIHMVEIGTDFWTRLLLFRDHIRKDKDDRNRYSELKTELAKQEWQNGNDYANAKTAFIKSIEYKAGTMLIDNPE